MTIKTGFFSVLALTAAAMALIISFHLIALHNLEEDATAMNLAGNLRFRTSIISNLTEDHRLAVTSEARSQSRARIEEEMEYIEQILVGLRHGANQLELKHPPTDDPAFLGQLAVVEQGWRSYRERVLAILASGTDNDGMLELRRQCFDLIAKTHKAVGLLEDASRGKVTTVIRTDLAVAVFVLLLFTAMIWAIQRRVLTPIKKATGLAARLASGDLKARIDSPLLAAGDDEVSGLTRALDEMAHRLSDLYESLEQKVQKRTEQLAATNHDLMAREQELRANYDELALLHRQLRDAQDSLIQAERYAGIGTLAAGVAHEINNPLAVMIGYADGIKRDIETGRFDAERGTAGLKKICESGWRCARIVAALRSYAGTGDMVMGAHDINAILEEAMADAASQCNCIGEKIEVVKELCETVSSQPLVCDRDKIRLAMYHLIMNAKEAMPGGGRMTIRSLKQNGSVHVEIKDTGKGVKPEVLRRISDPFFTTKEVGFGMGLGLAICHGVVFQHRGSIKVESTVGEGTRVFVYLPFEQGGGAGVPNARPGYQI